MDIAAMGTIDARTYRSGARRCRDDRTPRRTLAVGQWKMVVLPDQRAGRRNLRQWQALQRIVLCLQWAVDGPPGERRDKPASLTVSALSSPFCVLLPFFHFSFA